MSPTPSRISTLASQIATNTSIVDEYLITHNLPPLSFEPSFPSKIPIPASETEIIAAQDAVVSPNDVLSLQAVYHYKIASLIPLDGSATYVELSEKSGLNEIDLRRVVRHAMTNHVFQEREGRVAHTAASRILKEEGTMADIVGIMTEELFPGSARTVDALVKYNGAKEAHESGFSIGHNTPLSLYAELSHHPSRGRRFAGAMSGFADRSPIGTLAKSFDWDSVSTVVDVGGGWGDVSLDLARRFGHLRFTVQDLGHVIEGRPKLGEGEGEAGVGRRVEYVEHDFFGEQDAKGKDVYYFRYIFHNYPDESCVRLLKAQIPGLKKGAHILIQDAVIPEPRDELPAYKEKYRRSMDLVMLTFFGARERTLREWKEIVGKADERFEVRYQEAAPGTPSDILDVVWTSDDKHFSAEWNSAHKAQGANAVE
ncbi:uncharacterized protein KY384_008778 [Bacidia gigantensis]|uniref:uncharacterized protein n=1 Tax=Bacidia gigantensis TaxID=2732470 RepID=UPI001D052328|nr:uncharacterized protein KY384_008778 [Bacidia gigantensis]KAG8526577.1 hypothetical protein KY384_008778 [Bacidia gigantensis]